MNTLPETTRSVVGLIVEGEWAGLQQLTAGSLLSAEDIRRVPAEYGRTQVMPPAESFMNLHVIEVKAALPRTANVRVPLWTLEEGRSDLELGHVPGGGVISRAFERRIFDVLME